jgi:hypothetical protein
METNVGKPNNVQQSVREVSVWKLFNSSHRMEENPRNRERETRHSKHDSSKTSVAPCKYSSQTKTSEV